MKRWIWQAPMGLIIIGAGLSTAIDAGVRKIQGNSWFFYGSVALVIFNAGLCIFGDAIVRRLRASNRFKDESDKSQTHHSKN